ncbi:MAG: hypothetical protein K2Q09_11350, partial [Phycisphaerales bacterium]|nr:hypothetical protein [Phycisphaerales bacterium]
MAKRNRRRRVIALMLAAPAALAGCLWLYSCLYFTHFCSLPDRTTWPTGTVWPPNIRFHLTNGAFHYTNDHAFRAFLSGGGAPRPNTYSLGVMLHPDDRSAIGGLSARWSPQPPTFRF